MVKMATCQMVHMPVGGVFSVVAGSKEPVNCASRFEMMKRPIQFVNVSSS